MSGNVQYEPPQTPQERFSKTQWSVILRATQGTEGERKSAIESLCKAYWMPLYAYLRGSGRTHEDAQDLVQDFFVRLMDGRLLASADPAKGRFRTLMLTTMRNLEQDTTRASQAQKRGGQACVFSLDMAAAEESWQAEAGLTISAELAYDRAWATAVMDRAASRLSEECRREGKEALFAEAFPRITGASVVDDLEVAAARVGLSKAAFKTAITRLRRRYAEAMRDEVASTVTTHEEVQDELRYLLSSFS